MKMSKKASDARRKILKIYPNAKLEKYYIANQGLYGILVPYSQEMVNKMQKLGFWLEIDKHNSPSKEKAWIDGYKALMQNFINMLET